MGKIFGYIELSSFGRATSRGEVKTLNAKPEECCSREFVTLWYAIFQFSAHPINVVGSTHTSPL